RAHDAKLLPFFIDDAHLRHADAFVDARRRRSIVTSATSVTVAYSVTSLLWASSARSTTCKASLPCYLVIHCARPHELKRAFFELPKRH
ncbi:hypothetical protein OFN47_29170, partial [Escherichia coli]|nr:hypothetical protein [Escherichia coli]